MAARWTQEDDELVMMFYDEMALNKLAAQLHRTPVAIRHRYKLLSQQPNGSAAPAPAPAPKPAPKPEANGSDKLSKALALVKAALQDGQEVYVPAWGARLKLR